jgi:hypothetical protein
MCGELAIPARLGPARSWPSSSGPAAAANRRLISTWRSSAPSGASTASTKSLERLYEFEEEQFSKQEDPEQNTFAATSALLASSILTGGRPLTAEERAERLEAWRSEKPAHIAQGREHFLGVGLSGAGIRVVSRDRFVAKPHLSVTFHHCEASDYREAHDADYEKVVEPVMRRQDPFGPGFDASDLRITPRGYPIAWTNRGDDTEVVLTPDSFRPNVTWTSDQDDYVILARDPQAASVSVTWVLTEDGNDAVTSGEFEVTTADLIRRCRPAQDRVPQGRLTAVRPGSSLGGWSGRARSLNAVGRVHGLAIRRLAARQGRPEGRAIEELSEHGSAEQAGLRLLRNLHAIGDIEGGVFIHCDGALRAYTPEEYDKRKNKSYVTGRASASRYRKIFRLDGVISMET